MYNKISNDNEWYLNNHEIERKSIKHRSIFKKTKEAFCKKWIVR